MPPRVPLRCDGSNLSAADGPEHNHGVKERAMWHSGARALWRSGVAIATRRTADVSATSTVTSVPMAACARALDRRPRCLRLVPDGHEVIASSPILQSCTPRNRAGFAAVLIASGFLTLLSSLLSLVAYFTGRNDVLAAAVHTACMHQRFVPAPHMTELVRQRSHANNCVRHLQRTLAELYSLAAWPPEEFSAALDIAAARFSKLVAPDFHTSRLCVEAYSEYILATLDVSSAISLIPCGFGREASPFQFSMKYVAGYTYASYMATLLVLAAPW